MVRRNSADAPRPVTIHVTPLEDTFVICWMNLSNAFISGPRLRFRHEADIRDFLAGALARAHATGAYHFNFVYAPRGEIMTINGRFPSWFEALHMK
jgi:hypothetical protein